MRRTWDEEQVFLIFTQKKNCAKIEVKRLMSANPREAWWLTGLNAVG